MTLAQVSNTGSFGLQDWKNQIQYAKDASIDAFALNIARNEETNNGAVSLAFDAADAMGFKLFFSFDYAGHGAWDKSDVTDLITKYRSRGAYFHEGEKPFVSTFEGPDNAADWQDIKMNTNCFLIGPLSVPSLPSN
jgi:glycosyl hydrolase family 71